jgi:large subunit ribosomal protein L21
MLESFLTVSKYKRIFGGIESMFAVVEINDKQHLVKEGDILTIDGIIEDKTATFNKVLFFTEGDTNLIGQPYVEGISVDASIIESGKREKDTIFKFKRKTGYKVTRGHRQNSTLIKVTKISYQTSTKKTSQAEQTAPTPPASSSAEENLAPKEPKNKKTLNKSVKSKPTQN